ncbi:MAG: hypothetical protein ACYDHN_14475 [Solirubrobacteraceae bacterium]
MSTVLVAVAVLAGIACPLHMWWSHRRGRPGCMPASNRSEGEFDSARSAQQTLERSIAEVAARRPVEHHPRQATP